MSPVPHYIRQNLLGTCKCFLLRLTSSASKAPTVAGATLKRMIPIRNVYNAFISTDNDEDTWILPDLNEDEDSVLVPGSFRATTSKNSTSTPVCHPQPIRNYGKICPDLHTLDLDLNLDPEHQDMPFSPMSPISDSSTSETASLYTCSSSLFSELILDTGGRSESPVTTLAAVTFRSLPANWIPGQPLPDFATNHIREVAPGSETCVTVLAPPPPRRPVGELRKVYRNDCQNS